jgi:hypothetical protein
VARLDWTAVGERFFETGVDRGVLYIDGAPGVAWTGLTGVEEATIGGDSQGFYIDGVKYLNRLKSEEFEATITAYTYPDEFGQCDGTASIGNGLFARHQRRKPFGFSYRTMVGNDIDGVEHAYKVHLVYNALAQPSGASNKSLSDSADVSDFSWHITTKPSLVKNFAPSAHYVIDSREVPDGLLGLVEDILYGNPNSRRLGFLPRANSPSSSRRSTTATSMLALRLTFLTSRWMPVVPLLSTLRHTMEVLRNGWHKL